MPIAELTKWTLPLIAGASVTALAGCIDGHHFDHHDDHHQVHHDVHVDHHAPSYTVVASRPAPPAQPPVAGPGHWVWDDVRMQYLWVSERSQP